MTAPTTAPQSDELASVQRQSEASYRQNGVEALIEAVIKAHSCSGIAADITADISADVNTAVSAATTASDGKLFSLGHGLLSCVARFIRLSVHCIDPFVIYTFYGN